jgi:hypothetical protein
MLALFARCSVGAAATLMRCVDRVGHIIQSNMKYRPRDPEDRYVADADSLREKMMDKTLADSYPASDPPSSLPNPSADDSVAA